MFRTVQGIYRNGEVALQETPDGVRDGTPVLVTFLTTSPIDLADLGIGPAAAAELRARLSSFAVEWDSPEMDIYDDYDAVLTRQPAG
jgi:hypothetical protein